MSLWNKVSENPPPYDKEVLLLYKFRDEEVDYDNLFYTISARYQDKWFGERWTDIEYQGQYEMLYWMPLPDMPRLEKEEEE